ncbi:hypothetical protein GIB67_015141, partial [Kingdonia uniflora]
MVREKVFKEPLEKEEPCENDNDNDNEKLEKKLLSKKINPQEWEAIGNICFAPLLLIDPIKTQSRLVAELFDRHLGDMSFKFGGTTILHQSEFRKRCSPKKKKKTYRFKETEDITKHARVDQHHKDALRLNLLDIIQSFYLPNKGRNIERYVDLVDNLDDFNKFPWGQQLYNFLLSQLVEWPEYRSPKVEATHEPPSLQNNSRSIKANIEMALYEAMVELHNQIRDQNRLLERLMKLSRPADSTPHSFIPDGEKKYFTPILMKLREIFWTNTPQPLKRKREDCVGVDQIIKDKGFEGEEFGKGMEPTKVKNNGSEESTKVKNDGGFEAKEVTVVKNSGFEDEENIDEN